MSSEPMRCALPGCLEVIPESDDGGPRRLYCSAAHRSAARKQRQMARSSGDGDDTAVAGPAAAATAGAAATAAETPDSTPEGAPTRAPVPAEPIAAQPAAPEPIAAQPAAPEPIAAQPEAPEPTA